VIAFSILALVAVVASLFVVGSKNPVISALWLALTLVAVAGIFVVLHAEFLAAVQIIVYAGAILVFFLFVIMLLNLTRLPPGDPRLFQRWAGLYLALVVLVLIAFAVQVSGGHFGPKGASPPASVAAAGNTEALAALLYTEYVFPFELASVLLTAAVVGAVVLARARQQGGA
jgi:NADH-quinone oxidoreductase subunit J